jgi:N-acetylglutamate synthase
LALRFAHGFSSRANSASALSQDAMIDEVLLHRTKTFFDGHKLPAQFRISPLAQAKSIALLQSAGYSFKDEAVTMIAALSPYEAHPTVSITPLADDVWFQGVTALNADKSKREPSHLKSITARINPPVAFASVTQDGKTVGYAICAIHDGWAEMGSIIVAPEARGNGLGRALVTSLLHWAAANGAVNAFLQVAVENAVAIALYRSLGFADSYRYSTWRITG